MAHDAIKRRTIKYDKYVSLGKLLQRARQEKSMTMRDFAKQLSLPHTYIGKTENAERRLDVIEFIDYCKALGVDPVALFEKIVESNNSETIKETTYA